MIGRTFSLWKHVQLLCNIRILVPSGNSPFPGQIWKQVDRRCYLEQQSHCLLGWQMSRMSQKWQTFLGRKKISVATTAFLGGQTPLEHGAGLFLRTENPCHCNVCPIQIKVSMGNVLKNGNMSHGCLLKKLQWFLPLGEDKQQSKGHNLSRGVGKLKCDGLHQGHYY